MLCHSHRSFRAIVKGVRPISKRNNIIYYTFSNEHIQRANLEFTDKNVFIHRLFPKRNVSAGADILHCQESWNSRHWTISANISKNHHLKQTNRFNPAYWTYTRYTRMLHARKCIWMLRPPIRRHKWFMWPRSSSSQDFLSGVQSR